MDAKGQVDRINCKRKSGNREDSGLKYTQETDPSGVNTGARRGQQSTMPDGQGTTLWRVPENGHRNLNLRTALTLLELTRQ